MILAVIKFTQSKEGPIVVDAALLSHGSVTAEEEKFAVISLTAACEALKTKGAKTLFNQTIKPHEN